MKRRLHARGKVAVTRGRGTDAWRPLCHQSQRAIPQRVDLDWLADARRDDPIADLGIHPGQLHTHHTRAEQAIACVNTNIVAGAFDVPINDRFEDEEKFLEQRCVLRRLQVAINRVEIPERRVYRVVFNRRGCCIGGNVGETVGELTLVHVFRKGQKNISGFGKASRRQRQPFQRDHRIAPPIAKPRIPRDDRVQCNAFHLPSDNELIGG